MTDGIQIHTEGAVAEKPAKAKLKPPPMYKVILLNDDYTPMEFVVDLLMQVFKMDEPSAVQIMLSVHQKGKGICGIYTRDIAETKVAEVNNLSRSHQYPLMCTMEPDA